MDISALSSFTKTSDVADTQQAMGKEDFLTLLLTQLSNQDPLNPMDSAEFTSQLSQFASLEELTNANSTLSDILGFQNSLQNTMATNLIGKEVKIPGNTASLADTADLGFTLSDAASVKISIHNGSGTLVRTVETEAGTAGSNMYTWDGKDNNGVQLPAGTYAFYVEAQDASGNPVAAATSTSGAVAGVVYEDGITYLELEGGLITTLGQIQSVSERRL